MADEFDLNLDDSEPLGSVVDPLEEPARESSAPPPVRGRFNPAILVSVLLALVALFFTLWLYHTNGSWMVALTGLLKPWHAAGGAMDWTGLTVGIALVAICLVVGWYYLEGLEFYQPRLASAALAYIFGMGLVGLLLEWLAIPFALSRKAIAGALLALLLVLAWRAWRRHKQPPEADPGTPDRDESHRLLRRRLAREAFRDSLVRPRGFFARVFAFCALAVLGAITLANAWHALLYPVVYWDSLILYLGYARMTFLESGFPIKVTGQVGIGLGANYPHLYAVLGAGAATMLGEWTELPQRLLVPLCGLVTTVLVYHTALRLVRHVNFALGVALFFRCLPLAIMYDQYASDYALSILFGAAFLYLALVYIETALGGALAAMTLLIALAMHLNYLMGILWAPWALTLWVAHVRWREQELDPRANWTRVEPRPGLLDLIFSWRFWAICLGAGLLGATWMARNWIVTGNPVYAFFYDTLGGKNINPEVMAAASLEWDQNGAGIGSLDPYFGTRLQAAWTYFVDWQHAFKLAPVFMGLALPGLLVWAGAALASFVRRSRRIDYRERTRIRFGAVVACYVLSLLVFHFVLAPYYIYQIVMIAPGLALAAALAWPYWSRRPWRGLWGALALWAGIFPGLTMALMGWKITGDFQLGAGQTARWTELFMLRHPLPSREQVYAWRYGEDARMWQYINENLRGQRLLTHDNRHLAYDPSIEIVHLDDWEMQKLWKRTTPLERLRGVVVEHGIEYYLYIPNEDSCPTNIRMGQMYWIAEGWAEEVFEAGENRLYRLRPPQATPAPNPFITPPPTVGGE